MTANLPPCPTAGGGVNLWLPRAARILSRTVTDPAEVARIIATEVQGCGRPVRASEINRAVKLIFDTPVESEAAYTPRQRPKLPRLAIREELRAKAIRENVTIYDLHEQSPIIAKQPDRPEYYLDALWHDNDLLCIAQDGPATAQTKTLAEWRENLHKCDLIVPSAMTSRTGTNKSGQPTARALSNTCQRQHLVIEFDNGTMTEQASCLWHLKKYAPLVMVLHSGSKSLHGWYNVRGLDEEHIRQIHAYACTLGADPATFLSCQLVRLPAGIRGNGRKQNVAYFDPFCISYSPSPQHDQSETAYR